MRLLLRPPFLLLKVFWIILFGVISTRDVCASSALSLHVRIRQEFYAPLVPVSRNFRTCFTENSKGVQVMGICAGDSITQATRMPAAVKPSPLPSGVPMRPGIAPGPGSSPLPTTSNGAPQSALVPTAASPPRLPVSAVTRPFTSAAKPPPNAVTKVK